MTSAARLPVEPQARKAVPIATGCIDYFPDALAAIAELSRIGSEQHNPGKPLHWDRSKSTDEADCLMRHFVERGSLDSDGVRHSVKVAWRALALLQKEIESERRTVGPIEGNPYIAALPVGRAPDTMFGFRLNEMVNLKCINIGQDVGFVKAFCHDKIVVKWRSGNVGHFGHEALRHGP